MNSQVKKIHFSKKWQKLGFDTSQKNLQILSIQYKNKNFEKTKKNEQIKGSEIRKTKKSENRNTNQRNLPKGYIIRHAYLQR